MSSTEQATLAAEAESMVIGALMGDPGLLPQVGQLRPSEFIDPVLATIYRAALACVDDGEDPDRLAVEERLAEWGKLESIGGPVRLAYLEQRADRRQMERWIYRMKAGAMLREAAQRHAEAGAALEAMRLEDGHTALDRLVEVMLGNRDAEASPSQITTWNKAMKEALEMADPNAPSRDVVRVGLSAVDDRWLGLEPEQLVIVGARPGMGKTAFGVHICEAGASTSAPDGLTVMFSTEVRARKLAARALSARANVSARGFRTRTLTDTEVAKLVEATHSARRWGDRLLVEDASGQSPTTIMRTLRGLTRSKKLRLVVVDHLHQLRSSVPTRDDYSRFGDVADGLLHIARTFQVPLVAMAQLNREVEKRPLDRRRPEMADLRASGALEQHASIVAMLYREWVYRKEADPTECEIITVKAREGEPGTDKVRFDPQTQRFSDVPSEGWR